MEGSVTKQERMLKELVAAHKIRMCWSSKIMESSISAGAQSISEDRVRGMLIALAIGDSLGNTTEAQLPSERRQERGEIRDYLPNWFADQRHTACILDAAAPGRERSCRAFRAGQNLRLTADF